MNSKSNETCTEHSSNKFVLVTESSYTILKEILQHRFIGEICLYTDDDTDQIEGEFKNGTISPCNYSWKWAHKLYYSYERLTSDVGTYEYDDYYDCDMGEFIYIFENLTCTEISMIEHIVKDFSLLFKISDENLNFIDKIANITHNYYSAWERVKMKYHPFCENYDRYLLGARQQLRYLQQHLNEYGFDESIVDDIEKYCSKIESFEDDDCVRVSILNLYKRHVTLIH